LGGGARPGLHLHLGNNGLTDADLEPLAASLGASEAKAALATDKEGSAAGAVVAPSPLSGLSLTSNPNVTADGLLRLLKSASASLEALDVSECGLGPEGAWVLTEYLTSPAAALLKELYVYRVGLGVAGVAALVKAATQAPAMRALNIVANGNHCANWISEVGTSIATSLRADVLALRVLTVSCPEAELEAAQRLFERSQCRVILVPNEQNNYNRTLFAGHVHWKD